MVLWMGRRIACIEWVRNAPKSYQTSHGNNCHDNIKNVVRARTCEHGNELSFSVKGGEFAESLKECWVCQGRVHSGLLAPIV
jgi:hypothetical protein